LGGGYLIKANLKFFPSSSSSSSSSSSFSSHEIKWRDETLGKEENEKKK
jgi:hypothetical protein